MSRSKHRLSGKVFWTLLALVLAGLNLLVLGVVVMAPAPEPLVISGARVPPPANLGVVSAVVCPTRESLAVKVAVDPSHQIGKYQMISGWIFVDNQPTQDQEVYIQFEKPDGELVCYSTAAEARPDVGEAFANPLYKASGFNVAIPLADSVSLENCSVWFVVKNKGGIFKSPRWKKGIRFSVRTEIAAPEEESPAVQFGMDESEDREIEGSAYRRFSGWAYVQDRQTAAQEVYVRLERPDGTVEHYTTTPASRPDVAATLTNEAYAESGFIAWIPEGEGWGLDDSAVRLVVKNGGEFFLGSIWKEGIRISSHAEIAVPRAESPAVRFGVDSSEIAEKGGSVYRHLEGWAYVQDRPTAAQEVYIRLERPDGTVAHYATTPASRPDVAAAQTNEAYAESGFVAWIPEGAGWGLDDSSVRLVVKNGEEFLLGSIWKEGIQISSRTEIAAPEKGSSAVKFGVDSNEIVAKGGGFYRHLEGWAFVVGQPTIAQAVYVRLERPDGTVEHYSTVQIDRPDVGAAHGNSRYNASGFQALIPAKEGYKIDDGRIRFVVSNKSGIYISPEAISARVRDSSAE